jgi:hypothetical protein
MLCEPVELLWKVTNDPIKSKSYSKASSLGSNGVLTTAIDRDAGAYIDGLLNPMPFCVPNTAEKKRRVLLIDAGDGRLNLLDLYESMLGL